MLTSIALILLSGLFLGSIFSTIKLPSLLGRIIVGIVLSPHALNLIDQSILSISADCIGNHFDKSWFIIRC